MTTKELLLEALRLCDKDTSYEQKILLEYTNSTQTKNHEKDLERRLDVFTVIVIILAQNIVDKNQNNPARQEGSSS